MSWKVVLILFGLWLLGMVSSNAMGVFINALLVLAILVVVFRLVPGRKQIASRRIFSDARRSDLRIPGPAQE